MTQEMSKYDISTSVLNGPISSPMSLLSDQKKSFMTPSPKNRKKRRPQSYNMSAIFMAICLSGLFFLPIVQRCSSMNAELLVDKAQKGIMENFHADTHFISVTFTAGLALVSYKLLEFCSDWYRSSNKEKAFVSSRSYYFGILVFASIVSIVSLQLSTVKCNIFVINCVVLAAQMMTFKAQVRICLNLSYLSWSMFVDHVEICICYALSELSLLYSHICIYQYFLQFQIISLIFSAICVYRAWYLQFQSDTKLQQSLNNFNLSSMSPAYFALIIFLLVKFSFRLSYFLLEISFLEFAFFNYICFLGISVAYSHIPHYLMFGNFYTALVRISLCN